MKTRFRFRGFVALTALPLFGSALWSEETDAKKPEFVEPTSAEARSYRSAGEYAIDRLVMTLITDSARAVSGQQEVAALSTFHLKDVPMKDGTVAGLPRITAMKLTSFKVRNPANAPDEGEKMTLLKFRYELDNGTAPRVVVQRVPLANGKYEWRVYKPLANVRQCGTCHGNPEEQSPELRAALQAKYPNDEAVGYVQGEWRGLFRVTVADPPPPAAAKK